MAISRSSSLTEAISLADVSPAAHQQIAAQGMLQRSRQVLVEYAVQIIIIRTEVALELRTQPGVRVIDAPCVVVTLPELNRAYVRGEKYGTSYKKREGESNVRANGKKGLDDTLLTKEWIERC